MDVSSEVGVHAIENLFDADLGRSTPAPMPAPTPSRVPAPAPAPTPATSNKTIKPQVSDETDIKDQNIKPQVSDETGIKDENIKPQVSDGKTYINNENIKPQLSDETDNDDERGEGASTGDNTNPSLRERFATIEGIRAEQQLVHPHIVVLTREDPFWQKPQTNRCNFVSAVFTPGLRRVQDVRGRV